MAANNAAEYLRVQQAAAGRRHQSPDRGDRRIAGGAATGTAARAHRMLRHQHLAGHEYGRLDGRLCQRRAAQERLQALQDPRQGQPGRAGRLCQHARDVAPPLPPRRRGDGTDTDPGKKARTSDETWRILPDLVIVDGGKGQLGVAVEVLGGVRPARPYSGRWPGQARGGDLSARTSPIRSG